MLSEFVEIITDPAHVLAEGVFILVEMAILSPFVAWMVRSHDKRKHGHE